MRLVEDRRITGVTRYHVLREGQSLPQVPPDVLKCVAFSAPHEDADPDGTVFFVRVHADDPEWAGPVSAIYAVTAKHILVDYQNEAVSDSLWLRLNTRQGGVERLRTAISDWIQHPTTDVAVFRWPKDHPFDIQPFPLRRILLDDIIRQWNVGPGDEVFLTGLLWHHAGRRKNIPIVRVGNIATLSDEPVYTSRYGQIDAHLIEIRSLGGLSGSPVFLNGEGIRRMTGDPVHGFGNTALTQGFFLMGVVLGHYQELSRAVDTEEAKVNAGIAIVIPIKKVYELVYSQDEIEYRRHRDGESRRGAETLD